MRTSRLLRAVIGGAVFWLAVLVAIQPVVPPALSQTSAPPQTSTPPQTGQPGSNDPAQANQPYTVGPGDMLDVWTLGEPSASGTVTVDPDGNLTLPLTGQVAVGGLTVDQIAQKLAEVLKKYLRDPQVVVAIHAAAQRNYVYLMGQVTHPGAYQWQKGWSLAQLFSIAGGPTPRAALGQALILRNNTTIPIDLQRLLLDGDTTANVPLRAGDVVMVPETKNQVTIMGAVGRPGQYTFRPGDRVVDVLSAAGGPVQGARVNDIGVVRVDTQDPKKGTVLHVNLDKYYKSGDLTQDVALLPGDVVYVPQHTGVNWLDVLGAITGVGILVHDFVP
jgi:polysaccharide export outer membrane protein